MVFESFINPKSAEQKPWITFFLGFGLTSLAIWLANYIFPGENSSLTIVFLTTLFFIPLFYLTMIYEEKKDLDNNSGERKLLKEHSRAIIFFVMIFLGITLAVMFWYILFTLFPTFFNIDPDIMFKVQSDTISQINGNAIESVSGAFKDAIFILENNIQVLIFCVLFSFIFGAGAIFIITWNASVIGLALGREFMKFFSAASGGLFGTIYMKATGCALLRFFIHGIPEIMGYLVGGLAGGIISAAIIKHDFGSEKFEKVILDAALLLLIAFGILIVAALIEAFLTPLMMCRLPSS